MTNSLFNKICFSSMCVHRPTAKLNEINIDATAWLRCKHPYIMKLVRPFTVTNCYITRVVRLPCRAKPKAFKIVLVA